MRLSVLSLICVLLIGCATYTHQIPATKWPTASYNNSSCEDLTSQFNEDIEAIAQAKYKQDKIADGDVTVAWVSVLLFPIFAVAIDGDGPEATQYSILKGKLNAMTEAAAQKKCDKLIGIALNREEKINLRVAELKNQAQQGESSDQKTASNASSDSGLSAGHSSSNDDLIDF